MTNLTKAIAALTVVAGLGVASMPLSSHAETSATTNITVAISEQLSIESTAAEVSGTVLNDGPVVELKPASGKAGFKVTTNHHSGYTVSIKGTSNSTTLGASACSSATVLCSSNGDTIPAGIVAQESSFWSYKGGLATTETAITASDVKIAESDSPTDGTTVDVQYFASASASQAAGTYKGQATYSVTANN